MENPGFEDPRLEAILSRLEKVTKQGGGFKARCPAHEDNDPSLVVSAGEKGVVMHCWAGCNINEIRKALELPWSAMFWEGRSIEAKTQRIDRRGIELEAIMAAERLQDEPEFLNVLRARRGWAKGAFQRLGVGWDGQRLTIPVKDEQDRMHDVLRYDPFGPPKWKMLAGKGRSRLPWPRPESIDNGILWLVEGEGSVISMMSIGLQAVSLPGSVGKPSGDVTRPAKFSGGGWHPAWARRFKHFPRIICIPDCDHTGRNLMVTAGYDLSQVGCHVVTIDLGFEDGFDVGDFLKPAMDGVSRKHAKDLLLMMDRVTMSKGPATQLMEGREILKSWYSYMTSEPEVQDEEMSPGSATLVTMDKTKAVSWS